MNFSFKKTGELVCKFLVDLDNQGFQFLFATFSAIGQMLNRQSKRRALNPHCPPKKIVTEREGGRGWLLYKSPLLNVS